MIKLGITCKEENMKNCDWMSLSQLYYQGTLVFPALLAFLLFTQ